MKAINKEKNEIQMKWNNKNWNETRKLKKAMIDAQRFPAAP